MLTPTEARENIDRAGPTDQQPGAIARGVLKDQLDDARQELASDIDMLKIYEEQSAASQARVDALEEALADLARVAPAARPGSEGQR